MYRSQCSKLAACPQRLLLERFSITTEAKGSERKGSVGVNNQSVNYSVLSSQTTDNWTCNHNCSNWWCFLFHALTLWFISWLKTGQSAEPEHKTSSTKADNLTHSCSSTCSDIQWLATTYKPLTFEVINTVHFPIEQCSAGKKPGSWHQWGCSLTQSICLNALADQAHPPRQHQQPDDISPPGSTMCTDTKQKCSGTAQAFVHEKIYNPKRPHHGKDLAPTSQDSAFRK